MLVSVGLGVRLLVAASMVLSGAVEKLYPELAAVDSSFIRAAKMEMPLDILTGFSMIFWPFYLGWLEDKWKK